MANLVFKDLKNELPYPRGTARDPKGIDLELSSGDNLAIIGPSGSVKVPF